MPPKAKKRKTTASEDGEEVALGQEPALIADRSISDTLSHCAQLVTTITNENISLRKQVADLQQKKETLSATVEALEEGEQRRTDWYQRHIADLKEENHRLWQTIMRLTSELGSEKKRIEKYKTLEKLLKEFLEGRI
ncbi:uncharacterized protein EI97DRAFT_457681 [Westerdykella ornata]|uniref:Uncharacterized protein n=1 Tax=Westerdykella ornata TaxID=318751 RepID=A0A6A6JN70_WESOR|nr:uncharacterized protein EI97DRAFT_457681 [Westerdykella ornata]KAF2277694.1 hypothetical protein EI97DRAFT_457681 [Westerdykella ornata]